MLVVHVELDRVLGRESGRGSLPKIFHQMARHPPNGFHQHHRYLLLPPGLPPLGARHRSLQVQPGGFHCRRKVPLGCSSISCVYSPFGFFCKPLFFAARLGLSKGLKSVGLLGLCLGIGPILAG